MNNQQPYHTRATGQLDPEFGESGFSQLQSPDPAYPDYRTHIIGISPDNMIYVAGQASEGMNFKILTLARFEKNGDIDVSFGDKGYYHDFFYRSDDSTFYTEQIAFFHEKILLIGKLFHYASNGLRRDRAVACFLKNGTLDKSFGDNGKFIFHVADPDKNLEKHTTFNKACLEEAKTLYAKKAQPNALSATPNSTCAITNEHILLLHTSGSFDAIDSYIIRLDHHGKIDKSFNETGYVRVIHSVYPYLYLYTLIIDNAGNYISGGYVKPNYFESPDALAFVKHAADGRLDTSYQQNGFLVIPAENPEQYFLLEKIVKQTNNRVLCVGTAIRRDSNELTGLLISLEADGSRNIQFNSGTPVFTQIGTSNMGLINSDFQPDGSFLVTGLIGLDVLGDYNYVVARFLYNGVQDNDFGENDGWINYRQATNFIYHSSVNSVGAMLFAVEHLNPQTIVDSFVVRGLRV
jgi:uncharacterized delta-60 repeat protein